MRLLTDIRYALRTFRRQPTFVAGIVLTFSLVIGTNAAMFGLVRRLMQLERLMAKNGSSASPALAG